MTSSELGAAPATTGPTVTGQQWRWSVLAGMASYLDAGSIVAIGASLPLWQPAFGLSPTLIGLVAAIGPNAVGCAIGSVIGGRLGDLFGRKKIYTWDLVVYMVGVALIAVAVNTPMVLIGTVIVGLAVGADIPTSSALIGEFAPDRARGKLLGFSAVAWNSGPIVVLVLALLTSPLGLWSSRIVFAMLLIVALVTFLLRRGMVESARWSSAVRTPTSHHLRQLLHGPHLRAVLWTAAIYIFWGLAAGTGGIFTPYIVSTLGAGTAAAGVALSCLGFAIGIVVTVFVFMPLADRGFVSRKALWGVGSALQLVAYLTYLVLPFAIPVIILNIVLYGVGAALAGDAMYKVFSQELFPTMLRGTAQGFTFGVARLCLGIWSFFVPVLATSGIRPVAGLLVAFIAVGGLIGFFGMPDTVGKPLEQIEAERRTG